MTARHQGLGRAAWLGVACLGLLPLPRLAAEEPGLRATLTGHTDSVTCVAFSPDGKTLASGGDDKVVRLWDVAGGRTIATLRGHTGSVLAVSFSPDGKALASASGDNTIKLWDVPAATRTDR